MDVGKLTLLVGASAVVSTAAVLLLARFATALGLVDHPGGRKAHQHTTPLVGGLAIFFAVFASTSLAGVAMGIGFFLLALSIIIAVGGWDDIAEIRPRLKFAIQIVASAIMIWGAGVELRSLGDLLGWRSIGLSVAAIPLTIFAMVGVVNAVNMIDGLDGLAGSVAFVAFAWYALVSAESGLTPQFHTALIFCGAIGGFLIFNLRFPWQARARVFLGDAGSLMIGFALGWFAIDLTQGADRSFPPIAALWVLLLPLADCVSLMARRLRAGESPFVGDAHHIHHYLLRRGFSPSETVALLVTVSATFGAVGFLGWKLRLPESYLFWPFFVCFFVYHFWIKHAWAQLDRTSAALSFNGEGEAFPLK